MIVCKNGCFALHTVYTNCQLRAGLPAIRGAHVATAHNARSHGKCACYPTCVSQHYHYTRFIFLTSFGSFVLMISL